MSAHSIQPERFLSEHGKLVEMARKWLNKKHSVVVTELSTFGEEPDALGWSGNLSTLIEVKVSISDFMSDRHKPHRANPDLGVGFYRYYLTPPGLLQSAQLPDRWGLLETTPRGAVKMIKPSGRFPTLNKAHECAILLSTLRRIGQQCPQGVSIRAYVHETRNRASVSVAKQEKPRQNWYL